MRPASPPTADGLLDKFLPSGPPAPADPRRMLPRRSSASAALEAPPSAPADPPPRSAPLPPRSSGPMLAVHPGPATDSMIFW